MLSDRETASLQSQFPQNVQRLLKRDQDITLHLSSEELESVFNCDTYLGNIETLFDRLLGLATSAILCDPLRILCVLCG